MNDISLYELALGTNESLVPLQVSPATLKSIVDSTLGLLIDQAIPAMVWAKLPRGDVWQAELLQYCETVPTASVYLFGQQRDDASEEIGSGDLAAGLPESLPHRPGTSAWESLRGGKGLNLVSDTEAALTGEVPGESRATLTSLLLSPDSLLKREYFLIVLSAQFCNLILAHRPRSRQPKPEASGSHPAPKSSTLGINGSIVEEDPGDRKQPLLTICSFEPAFIQTILPGLQQIKSVGGEPFEPEQIDWPFWLGQVAAYAPNSELLTQLFARQIQHQEEFWHRTASYRKQAETAATLQGQNESLLQAIRLKDEFLNNVGQELRTPLTTMKTALTLLNSAQLKPAQRQRYMQMLSTECAAFAKC